MASEEFRRFMLGEQSTAEEAQQMRAALLRRDAPDGFTERLLERLAQQEEPARTGRADAAGRRGVLLQFTRPAWRIAYAVAAMLAITAGTVHVQHVRSERRADEAAAQLDTALQVTHHALDHVSAKLETTEFGEVQRALEAHEGGK